MGERTAGRRSTEDEVICVLSNIVEEEARKWEGSIEGSGRRPTLNYRERGGKTSGETLVGPAGGLSRSALATY